MEQVVPKVNKSPSKQNKTRKIIKDMKQKGEALYAFGGREHISFVL